jgi:hypothetical protein
MKIMVELGPCIRTFDLFQDAQFLPKSGIRKSWKSGIKDWRSSEITDLRNYAFRSPKFGSHDEGFGNQKEAKSKTLPQKSGFGV